MKLAPISYAEIEAIHGDLLKVPLLLSGLGKLGHFSGISAINKGIFDPKKNLLLVPVELQILQFSVVAKNDERVFWALLVR
jgi:hypothetical protein